MITGFTTTDLHKGFNQKTHLILEKFYAELRSKMDEEGSKLLVIPGDHIINKQDQLPKMMRQLRNHFGLEFTIIVVCGNHDYWNNDFYGSRTTLQQVFKEHDKIFQEHGIIYLNGSSCVVEDVIFCGFDGWYGNADPETNDMYHLPKFTDGIPTMRFMSNKAYKDLEKVLNINTKPYRASVCVTHFPPFREGPNEYYNQFCANFTYLNFIAKKFDLLITGHNHIHGIHEFECDGHKCLAINAGSDYNKPKWLKFTI